jgi:hypoxanthine phosphoribosyltransferase
MKNIYLDYNQISLSLDVLSEQIKMEDFEGIVIVLRGGSFPGFHLAFLTGIPYFFLQYTRSSETVNWLGEIPKSKKILLIEDFAGMGKTLITCKDFLVKQNFKVKTLVVCKDTKSASTPDYYCFETLDPNSNFILPWERYRINPKADQDLQIERKKDHCYQKTLWDSSLSSFMKEGDGIITLSKENKGEMAISSGFTHLVLEDLEEAVLVSSRYPELQVAWWNGEKNYYIQSRETT